MTGFAAAFVVAQATHVTYATRTLDGAEMKVGAGEPATIVAVFATWCTSCKNEFGTLDSLQKALAPRGIRVLALSVDDAEDAVSQLLARVPEQPHAPLGAELAALDDEPTGPDVPPAVEALAVEQRPPVLGGCRGAESQGESQEGGDVR